MEIVGLTLFLLSFALLILCCLIGPAKIDDETKFIIITVVLTIVFVVGFTILLISDSRPKPIPAIEVYRGNTDLKVSYIDSIPQDSIVVWKQITK